MELLCSRRTQEEIASAIPYKLYKNALDVLRFLWRLMRIAWQK